MTIEAVKEALCERECEHFGVSPFTVLDAIGAKIVEEYARMVERLQQDPRLDLSKAQLDALIGQWTMHVESALDRNYELFEAYSVRNVFSIPAGHVPEYLAECASTGSVDENVDAEMAAIMGELQKAKELKQRLKAEEARMSRERAQLERVEALFQVLKETIDSHFVATANNNTFEATMVDLCDQVNQLRVIVTDTLEAASNFLPTAPSQFGSNVAVVDEETVKSARMYEQLLKELTVLDPEAVAAKENRAQAEAQQELAQCLEVATLSDIQMMKAMLRPKPSSN